MNTLGKLFLKGLAIVVPIGFTLSILWWLANKAEHWLGGLMQAILPAGTYIPGMGVVAGVATIILLGLLSHILIFRRLIGLGEQLVKRVPLVKTVYSALKDIVSYFGADTRNRFSKVVMVQLPGQPFKLVGFVTRESMQQLNLPVDKENTIAVYLPMSYQIGGYTAYIRKDAVEAVDMKFEEAMRLTLTAGVSSKVNPTD
jgi:uncharacterized membrane protein